MTIYLKLNEQIKIKICKVFTDIWIGLFKKNQNTNKGDMDDEDNYGRANLQIACAPTFPSHPPINQEKLAEFFLHNM